MKGNGKDLKGTEINGLWMTLDMLGNGGTQAKINEIRSFWWL